MMLVHEPCEFVSALKHFPAKWIPVRVEKMRPNKGLESVPGPIGTEKALEMRQLRRIGSQSDRLPDVRANVLLSYGSG
jgi:hypothetical protein